MRSDTLVVQGNFQFFSKPHIKKLNELCQKFNLSDCSNQISEIIEASLRKHQISFVSYEQFIDEISHIDCYAKIKESPIYKAVERQVDTDHAVLKAVLYKLNALVSLEPYLNSSLNYIYEQHLKGVPTSSTFKRELDNYIDTMECRKELINGINKAIDFFGFERISGLLYELFYSELIDENDININIDYSQIEYYAALQGNEDAIRNQFNDLYSKFEENQSRESLINLWAWDFFAKTVGFDELINSDTGSSYAINSKGDAIYDDWEFGDFAGIVEAQDPIILTDLSSEEVHKAKKIAESKLRFHKEN